LHPAAVGRRLLGLMKGHVILPMPVAAFGFFAVNNLVQDYFGTGKDFFHGSFTTRKDPDDIAEFYQAEDLLKVVAGHPFFFRLFMDKVVVGDTPVEENEALLCVDESRMTVKNLGMEVAFEITDQEEDFEGKTIRTFTRHERFLDYIPVLNDWGFKVLLWDQTWTYGFRCHEGGLVEVYHHGNDFYGPWPVRLIVQLHQRYVLWACNRLINSEAFGNDEDGFWADKKQEMLDCMARFASPFRARERTYSEGSAMRIVIN